MDQPLEALLQSKALKEEGNMFFRKIYSIPIWQNFVVIWLWNSFYLMLKLGFQLAKALINMGLREEARQDLLVVIRFDPKNEEIRKELKRVEEFSYRMIERGNKAEVFDKNSISYMVVHVVPHNLPNPNEHEMCVNEQGSLTTNEFQFSAQRQDKHKKGKQHRRKNTWRRQKGKMCKTLRN
ncbi:hypothetical protein Cgig2_014178 [Carnegiea gigantea]|uniref:Uncharacterized protein n=1 Tax=Carnegiea gigantea TaxID=171969 RepID=A0A9Q1K705_9CARY|nr:hypothetical protein Cgig2_014178 [Carnegiea gigantea]